MSNLQSISEAIEPCPAERPDRTSAEPEVDFWSEVDSILAEMQRPAPQLLAESDRP